MNANFQFTPGQAVTVSFMEDGSWRKVESKVIKVTGPYVIVADNESGQSKFTQGTGHSRVLSSWATIYPADYVSEWDMFTAKEEAARVIEDAADEVAMKWWETLTEEQQEYAQRMCRCVATA